MGLSKTGRGGSITNFYNLPGLPERVFSGFIAWWLWRTIYLSKLPRFEKKLRVMLDWTLDLIFSKDLVQFQTLRTPTVSQAERDTRLVRSSTA